MSIFVFMRPEAILIRARVVDEHLVVSFCVRAGTQLATRRRNVSELSVLNRPALGRVRACLPLHAGVCGRANCFRKEN